MTCQHMQMSLVVALYAPRGFVTQMQKSVENRSACAVKKKQILTASYIYCPKLNVFFFLLHVPFQTSFSVLSLGPTACACDATLCDCFRLQLTRDLCDCFNYFFSTNTIADQSPTSRRTIGDSFCMPVAIGRRLVAVELQLIKSDLQSNGDF